MDIGNDLTRDICTLSLNYHVDGNYIQDHIPSSWRRSSATYSTHPDYWFPEVNRSSTSTMSYQKSCLGRRLIQNVWWHINAIKASSSMYDTYEQTVSLRFGSLTPIYNVLASQYDMDSLAYRVHSYGTTRLTFQPHICRLTFPSADSKYIIVPLDNIIEAENEMRLWGVIYCLVPYYSERKILDNTLGASPTLLYLQLKLTHGTWRHVNTLKACLYVRGMDDWMNIRQLRI